MSQPEVDKLSALLQRVQENRDKPRAARGAARGPEVQAAPAARERAPDAGARPRQATPVEERSIKAPEAPIVQPARRPGQDRRATPLEMAFTGDYDRAVPAAVPEPKPAAPVATSDLRREPAPAAGADPRRTAAAAPAAGVDARRETAGARPGRTAAAPAEPIAAQEIVPRVIEPDPPREIGRPIAQVVSRHAPALDATFGAMLKRSLSLRPH